MNDIKICYVCGGAPHQRTTIDRNFIGELMFKSVMVCKSCGRTVEAYSKDKDKAEQDVRDFWNGRTKNE